MIIEETSDDIRIEGEDSARSYGLSAHEFEGHLWLEVFNSSDGNHTIISADDASKLGRWLMEWARHN